MSKEARLFAFAAICTPIGGYMLSDGNLWGWFFIGMGLIVGFIALTLKPKEIIKNIVATQVITVENNDYQFRKKDGKIIIGLNPAIIAIPEVRVEDIQLELKGK